MRVAWFPKAADLAGNPYWELLAQELQALGIEFENSHNGFWMARRWLIQHRRSVDVLHFHFIQPHYAAQTSQVALKRLRKFALDLMLARTLGYRVVWTLHDLMPTWPLDPVWADRLARYVIAQLANDVIVHCEEARRLLWTNFRRGRRVWTIPHAGFEPPILSQAEARIQLGLPPAHRIIAFVGGIRPNKGIEDLIAAFVGVNDPTALLLIAGKPWPPQPYVDEIMRLAASDGRILLRAEPIAHPDLQVWARAADVIVLPFKAILTSSSAVLVLSCGRPIIVPQLGCLPELVDSEAGFAYDPNAPGALEEAIRSALAADLDRIGAAGMRRVNTINWSDMARLTEAVYTGRL